MSQLIIYSVEYQVPDWATKDEVVELDKLLDSNVNMSYGGETLTPEQVQRVKDILIANLLGYCERRQRKRQKDVSLWRWIRLI